MIEAEKESRDRVSTMRPPVRLVRIRCDFSCDTAVAGSSVNSLAQFRVEHVQEGKTR